MVGMIDKLFANTPLSEQHVHVIDDDGYIDYYDMSKNTIYVGQVSLRILLKELEALRKIK